ncbi:unnamed protein product [Arctogadus glacialis]
MLNFRRPAPFRYRSLSTRVPVLIFHRRTEQRGSGTSACACYGSLRDFTPGLNLGILAQTGPNVLSACKSVPWRRDSARRENAKTSGRSFKPCSVRCANTTRQPEAALVIVDAP